MSDKRPQAELRDFALVLGGLALLRVAIGFLPVPTSFLVTASLLVSAVFVAAPILALYRGAAHPWGLRSAGMLLGAGAITHIVCALAVARMQQGLGLALLGAVGQAGLVCWCLGLGAIVAGLLKDRNLLLPVAIFLAFLDIFLVATPVAPTTRLIQARKEQFAQIAYTVPKPEAVPQSGRARTLAYVGPADFFILATFFVAIHRFRMRSRETLLVIVPTLIGYLLIVLLLGGVRVGGVSLAQLPALLPIGAVVLIVNRREFKLTRDEKVATLAVAGLGLLLVIWGATRRAPQAAPLPPGLGQAPTGSAGLHAPEPPDRPR
ncbi:MAG: hypothetical protein HYR64_08515 [Fimbriimonas ginsengisoli]|uniref:Uncharacterized protein n=1 Tax=Fimbriimonas ginsengisoli TaxID=1005039 RepID=A0A931LWU2_FIMGI|nr:hypothetical protein [Fimbriimonas ginsengisoli]